MANTQTDSTSLAAIYLSQISYIDETEDGNPQQKADIITALGNVDSLVAYPLQIGINLDYGHDEAEVDCHGLLHGEKIESELVNLTLGRIDLALAFQHRMTDGQVALGVSAAGTVYRLLGQSTHEQQTLAKFIEGLLKPGTHYPNLPVM